MRVFFIAISFFLTGFSSAVQANHIDFLVDGGFDLTADDFATQTGDPGNILGSERDVDIFSFGNASASLNAPPGPGPVGPDPGVTLDFTSDDFSSLNLIYDGAGTTGLGGVNLITNGTFVWDSLEFFLPTLSGMFDLDVFIEDTMGNNDNVFQMLDSAGSAIFSYSDFSGVDFTSVNIIDVLLTTEDGGSFSLGAITRELQQVAVPLPSTIMLLGLGMLVLVSNGRRPRALR